MLMEKISSGRKQVENKRVTKSVDQTKKKKTKKLTCRQDKARAPRRRKNQDNQLRKRTVNKVGKKATVKQDMNTNVDEEKLTCFCREVFSEPPMELWIQCNLCKGGTMKLAQRGKALTD